ncbi:MAG: fimbrillin family protein [Bacteroidales bacterium]|nr:fimbrillin family protein [Bacteroidales bacterium]
MIRSREILALACIVLLSANSCTKIVGHHYGDSIYFSASSKKYNNETKTEYSGEVLNGIERINWIDGDKISVYCAQVSDEVKTSDYVIDATTISNNGRYSDASIAPANGNGLHWGDGTHTFYARYPNGSITRSGSAVTMSGNIPATQTGVPNMDYAYMYAVQSASESDPSLVQLDFKPMFSAYEFEVSADADMTLTSVVLSSTTGNLSGSFTARFTGTTPSYTYSSSSNAKKVTIDLSALNSKTVGKNKTVKFTALTPPNDMSGVIAKFVLANKGARLMSLKNADKSDIVFTGGRKFKIFGIEIPEKVWTDVVADEDETDTYEHFTSKPYIDFTTDTDHGFEEGEHAGEQIDFPITSYNINQPLLIDIDANEEHIEAFHEALEAGEQLFFYIRFYVEPNQWYYWLHVELLGPNQLYNQQQYLLKQEVNFNPATTQRIKYQLKLPITSQMVDRMMRENGTTYHEGLFHLRGGNITIEGAYIDIE